MPTDYYLQNRTFDKDRDIECGGDMFVGRDVLPSNKYLYQTAAYPNLNTTETKKTQSNGSVVISNGKSINLEAKNYIRITPGFKVTSGSSFTAKVDGTDPNTRSDESIQSCCKIVKGEGANNSIIYSLSGHCISADWNLRGYKTDITSDEPEFTIPEKLNKGQYSLNVTSANCPIESVVLSVNNNKVNQNSTPPNSEQLGNSSSLNVIPNPTNGSFSIISDKPMKSIDIIGSVGQLVYEIVLPQQSKEWKVNLLNMTAGIYTIKVKYDENEIETKKIVVQN
jgi:hypothetical protein